MGLFKAYKLLNHVDRASIVDNSLKDNIHILKSIIFK